MPKFSKDELKEAFEAYDKVRIRCSETGDWSQYADLFVEDAHYIEHAYGDMRGLSLIHI